MVTRHEINVLNGSLALSATTTLSEKCYIDTSKYSGTLTAYVEVLYTNTSGTSKVFSTIGQTGANVTLNATSTFTLSTSATFTPATGETTFSIAAAATVTIKAVRVIILQDDGTSATTALESQFEIGNRETAVTVTSTNTLQPLAAPKYWQYNASNFNGGIIFYGEVTYNISSTTGNKTIVIQESPDLSTWTTAATMLSASSGSTTATRVRSSAFTPKDGYYYRLAWTNSSTMTSVSIYNAKIIVDQGGTGIIASAALNSGQNAAFAMCVDDYLYIATYTNPSILLRIDKSSLAVVSSLTLASGIQGQGVYVDSTDIYVLSNTGTAPCKIVKVSKSSFTVTSTLTLNTSDGLAYSIIGDSTDLYCGTNAQLIVKISKSSFTETTTCALASGEGNAYNIIDDGTSIYAAIYSVPGKIVQIDKSTFTRTTGTALSSGESNAYSLFVDSSNVYVGLDYAAAKLIKFDKSLNRVSDYTPSPSTGYFHGLTGDSNYLYVSDNVSTGCAVRKVDKSTMTLNTSITSTYQQLVTGVIDSQGGVYFANNQSPADIVKISTEITKTEEHYLLANTTLAAGTALQNFLTKWDSTQWDTTNTYIHQVEASASNTSVVEIDGITSGSAVTNSSISSPNIIKQSSAMTMPSSQNLDVKATTNSGSIYASRIIVQAIKTIASTIAPRVWGFIIGG